MSRVIFPPTKHDTSKFTVFLSGSIDMGHAIDWQSKIIEEFKYEEIIFFNPRRKEWDSTWVQSIDNPVFKEQVEWELTGLDLADLIVVYFDPNGKAPITLMELGLHKDDNMVVCCPEGYFRKGNVDIVCHKYGIKQVPDLDGLIQSIREGLKQYKSKN